MMDQDPILVRYKEEDREKWDRWELLAPVRFETSLGEVIAPVGYQTDFASSPPWLWSVIPPIGRHNRACLLHDLWYDHRLFEDQLGAKEARRLADRELLEGLNRAEPRRWIRNYLMFLAVRIGGRSWWEK